MIIPKLSRCHINAQIVYAWLFLWLGNDSTNNDFNNLLEAANLIGDAKNHIAFAKANSNQTFSPAALRKATHFITTREMSTLEALDYLWNTDVKIVSALDDGIFSQ